MLVQEKLDFRPDTCTGWAGTVARVKRLPPELAAKLDAIADEFLSDGDLGRMDAVAAAIDVPRTTLYYHFSGKDDLVAYFMHDKMQRVEDRVADALAVEAEPLDRFTAALYAAAHELASNPAVCLNIMVGMSRAGAMDELMAAGDQRILTPLRAALAEAAADKGIKIPDVEVTVMAIMGGIYMAVVQKHSRGRNVDPDQIADTIVTHALHGILGR